MSGVGVSASLRPCVGGDGGDGDSERRVIDLLAHVCGSDEFVFRGLGIADRRRDTPQPELGARQPLAIKIACGASASAVSEQQPQSEEFSAGAGGWHSQSLRTSCCWQRQNPRAVCFSAMMAIITRAKPEPDNLRSTEVEGYHGRARGQSR